MTQVNNVFKGTGSEVGAKIGTAVFIHRKGPEGNPNSTGGALSLSDHHSVGVLVS